MQSEPRSARTPVWALSISLAATLEIEFSFFSSGYLDVSVHRVPSVWLWIHHTVTEVCSAGFPHSEIAGSMDICSSPTLIAAYHVFLRLLVPRHPPCALISLTKCDFSLNRLAWRYFGRFVVSFDVLSSISFRFTNVWYFKIFSIFGFQCTMRLFQSRFWLKLYQSLEKKIFFPL